MAKKTSNKTMTPPEIQKAIQSRVPECLRAWDLGALLDDISRSLKRPGDRAGNAAEWVVELRAAVGRGDAVAAAVLGLKIGAAANQVGSDAYTETWLKPVDVTVGLGFNRRRQRHEVTRLVDQGRLRTNGKRGHGCRIDPQSILRYCKETNTQWNTT